MLRDALIRPPARPGSNAAAKILDPPALRTDAGQQEHGVRHQLSSPAEMLRSRRAEDRTDIAQPRWAGRAELGDQHREPLPQMGPVGEHQILHIASARVGRTHEHEHPRARGDQRREGVEPEQRVGGERVGSEPLSDAGRRLHRPDERLRVRGSRDRHVAALAVGNHQQPRRVRVVDDRSQRLPAVCAEPLEAGKLRLGCDARFACGIDNRRAMTPHRRRGPRRDAGANTRGRAIERRCRRDRPQASRVRVQASTTCDSRAATRSASASAKPLAIKRLLAAASCLLEGRPRREAGNACRRNLDALASAWVHAPAAGARADMELAEARHATSPPSRRVSSTSAKTASRVRRACGFDTCVRSASRSMNSGLVTR